MEFILALLGFLGLYCLFSTVFYLVFRYLDKKHRPKQTHPRSPYF